MRMLPGTCRTSPALNLAAPGAQGTFLPTHDVRACLLTRGQETPGRGIASALPRHWFLS